MSIKAINAWQKEQIPDELNDIVKEAVRIEPNEGTRASLEALLARISR